MSNKSTAKAPCKLVRDSGRMKVQVLGETDLTPASIVYLRPLSTRTEVALFNDDGKEILWLESLDQLDESSQQIAREELAKRYHLPKITEVHSIETIFGSHYWRVDTDKGPVEFVLKEPGKNVTTIAEGQYILRDTIGNRYEVPSVSALSRMSQSQLDKLL